MNPEEQRPSFWKRNALSLKAGLVLLLVFLLLIPTGFIQSLIHERENRRWEVVREITDKWSLNQTITGPVLTVPYIWRYQDEKKQWHTTTQFIHFLPENLVINGEIIPHTRYRGIYEVMVYEADLDINATFGALDFSSVNVPEKDILLSKAVFNLGITDLRGIETQLELEWNGSKHVFDPGIKQNHALNAGIHTQLDLSNPESPLNFHIRMDLKGSHSLQFVPVGKTTQVAISSPSPNPSFDGEFLPDARQVTPEGFQAQWDIFHLNRNFPQLWTSESPNLDRSAFGVSLLLPVDNYQKSIRSVKYALMVIALTFMLFFFVEVLNHRRIHPMNYLLIGLALVVFYVLLISISEHLAFNRAYLISATSTFMLIALYVRAILQSTQLALLAGGILFVLYGFIFILIQQQDFALLLGSIGMFGVLAITMYVSRKVDWYGYGK